jgi:hypothetical protein
MRTNIRLKAQSWTFFFISFKCFCLGEYLLSRLLQSISLAYNRFGLKVTGGRKRGVLGLPCYQRHFLFQC